MELPPEAERAVLRACVLHLMGRLDLTAIDLPTIAKDLASSLPLHLVPLPGVIRITKEVTDDHLAAALGSGPG